MIIIFIGPPGSGKGTQALEVSRRIGAKHLSTGEMLRKMAGEDSEDARRLRDIMLGGRLVPSEMVNQCVLETLQNNPSSCILDGYPRSIDQAEFLSKYYDGNLVAVLFSVKYDVLMKRIIGRFSCANCGTIYNRYFHRTVRDNICDNCGSVEFVSRFDDQEEIIKMRLSDYEKEIQPVIEHYKKLNMLHNIDADRDANLITEEVLSVISSM